MPKTPFAYDTSWKEKYRDFLVSAEQAVSHIRAGQRVFVGTGCAQPSVLVEAMVQHADELVDTEIVHLLTFGGAPYATKELSKNFRVNSFFIAENVRDTIQEGLGDYTPIMLSDIPRLFRSGQIPLDVSLIQVTPPDEHGRCSLGVSVDIVKSAAENSSLVIAQINPQMPWTHGDSTLNIFDFDYVVASDVPLHEVEPPETTDVSRQIGEHIAALIDDGCTLELGIGQIPQSVLEFLDKKKDLGIHTEMFTDRLIEAIESGAINGNKKTLDKHKIVASFCVGTKRIFDFIDNNPLFSFQPTEVVNDPHVISQQNKMVAINVALEVDLTGQVCADSLGTKFFSGIGGQVDFNRGAAKAENGKAIIALPSTAKNGTISRIATRLSNGAGVVTTRGDVHYVVTEHGVAYLHGKNVQERALALISVAHPDFRPQLLREAIEAKYIRSTLSDVEGRIRVSPRPLRSTFVLRDGTQIGLRSIQLTDEPKMKNLVYALSQQTMYSRFMRQIKFVPKKDIQNFVFIDHRTEVGLVATLPESDGEEIVAVGRYYLDPKTNRAEVAFTTRDDWQGQGIGTQMMRALMKVAKRNGIQGFTAEVLAENRPMQRVFEKSGCKIKSHMTEGIYSYEMDFV